MKIYDKDIYKKQESIKMTFIIIIVFLLGFVVGHLATSYGIVGGNTDNNTVNESHFQNIETHDDNTESAQNLSLENIQNVESNSI